MKLSERRTKSVTAYLQQQGIAANRIQGFWYGKSQPKVPNDTDANRALNRRCEFSIFANDKMKNDAKKEAGQQ
jgi:outer membrane protein OmpA-like peptidoglycan-associated protein